LTRVRIYGAPGTGKTTFLVKCVKFELEQHEPEEIAFYSFSKAASAESLSKLREAMPDIDIERFEYFRTIHSQAYHLLGLTKDDVMTGKWVRKFSDDHGYELSPQRDEHTDIEDTFPQVLLQSLGDYLLFFENWRRHKMLFDIDAAFRQFYTPLVPQGFSLAMCHKFHREYEKAKQDYGKLDYTDMLTEVLKRQLVPAGVRVMMVDESQDQSGLLMAVFNHWVEKLQPERVYLAGDPNQAIYEFMAADPRIFLEYPCDKEVVLSKSWRLPRGVYDYSNKIIKRNRLLADPSLFAPRDVEGSVSKVPLEYLKLGEESTFLLARNRYLLQDFIDYCEERGVVYSNLLEYPALERKEAKVMRSLVRLKKGQTVTLEEIARIMSLTPSKDNLIRGAKAEIKRLREAEPWQELNLNDLRGRFVAMRFADEIRERYMPDTIKVEPKFRRYLLTLARQDKLDSTPKVRIGTIHSVKGKEAECVAVMPDMSWSTFTSYHTTPEVENRVAYVAATRSRDKLVILEPSSDRFYRYP